MDGSVVDLGGHVYQLAEVEQFALLGVDVAAHDKVSPADDIIELREAHLSQIFAHFLSEHLKIVYHIFALAAEALAQLLVLSGDAHRASIGVALTHHDATQSDEHSRTEAELLGAEQSHEDNIAACLHLTVHLEAYLSAQAVAHKRLLCVAEAELRSYARIVDRGTGRSARTAVSTRDGDEVSLCLGHTGSNRTDTALCYEFHTDGSLRVDILEVEDELCQILDRVYIVMRRGRDERDTRDGVTHLGDDLVHLVTGKLTALSGLCALGYLDLYLVCINQIFRRHTEAARSHLLDGAARGCAVGQRFVAVRILAALSGVAACVEGVHGDGNGLVSLLAESAETHSARHEMLDDALHGLHFLNGNGVALEVEEVAYEYRLRLIVRECGKLLELLIVARARSQLQRAYRVRIPGVEITIFAIAELADKVETLIGLAEACVVHLLVVGSYLLKPYAVDRRRHSAEVSVAQFLAQAHSLEYLCAAIGANGADAHLAHHLEQALAYGLDIIGLGGGVVELYLFLLHKVIDNGEGHIRIEGAGSEAQEKGCVLCLSHLAGLDDDSRLYTLAY